MGRDGTLRFIEDSTASAPTSPGTVKNSDMSDGGGSGGGGGGGSGGGNSTAVADSESSTPDTPVDKKEIRWHPDVVEKAVNEEQTATPAAVVEETKKKAVEDEFSPGPTAPAAPKPKSKAKGSKDDKTPIQKLATAKKEHLNRKADIVREAVKAQKEGRPSIQRLAESSDEEQEDEKVLEQSPGGKYYKVNKEIGRGSFKAVYRYYFSRH